MDEQDISFNDTPGTRQIFRHWFCSAVVYGVIILIFNFNRYFYSTLESTFMGLSARNFFNIIFVLYLLLSPVLFYIFKPKTLFRSHTILVFNYFKRIICSTIQPFNQSIAAENEQITSGIERFIPDKEEATALGITLIKMFFGSFVLGSLFITCENIRIDFPWTVESIKNIFIFNKSLYYNPVILNTARDAFYTLLLNLMYFADLFCFAIGYLTESTLFNNRIKSVDLTPAGIFFCLSCYPPFNDTTGTLLGGYLPESLVFNNSPDGLGTWILKCIYLFFLFIYAAASVALFAKASNLTNRGIVDKWPYSMVRHPAYASKILFWSVPVIPLIFLSFKASGIDIIKCIVALLFIFLNILSTTFLYYFRAVTEERHLLKDEEYVKYCKKVKYRFIPYIW